MNIQIIYIYGLSFNPITLNLIHVDLCTDVDSACSL